MDSVVFDNLGVGMISDIPVSGSIADMVNFIPYKGVLYRRGSLDDLATLTIGASVESRVNNNDVSRVTVHPDGWAIVAPQVDTEPGGTYIYSGSTWTKVGNGDVYGAADHIIYGDEVISVNGHSGYSFRFDGSVGANYSNGAINVTSTAGSNVVTFASPISAASAQACGYITINGNDYHMEQYVSTTRIVLSEPARATYTGNNWQFKSYAKFQYSPAESGSTLFNSYSGSSGEAVYASCGCSHQGRLLFGDVWDIPDGATAFADGLVNYKTRFRVSALKSETDTGYFKGKQYFDSQSVYTLDSSGGKLTGMFSYSNALVVIREKGVDVVTGGFATSGADIGATVQQVTRSAGGLNTSSSVETPNGIAFADKSGVYLWNGSSVASLTDGKISNQYRKAASASGGNPRIVLSYIRGRLIVNIMVIDGDNYWFVFDFSIGGWYRLDFNGYLSNIVEFSYNKYIVVDLGDNSGSTITTFKSYNAFGVFNNLNSAVSSRTLDDNNASVSSIQPLCSLVTNPVQISGGLQGRRVTEMVFSDGGGWENNVASFRFAAVLYNTPVYNSFVDSSNADLGDTEVGTVNLPEPGSDAESTQRLVRAGVVDQQPCDAVTMVLDIGNPSSTPLLADAIDYGYALRSVAFIVDSEERYDAD